uniref:cytochrome b n=1 Tax=Bakuella subtropica TaxID=1295181 RepID=UPI0023F52689|nr:cytochrome b [Bakuella subtropica]WDY80869.1 cytochrome b [Bakuella subtropica]
MPLLEGRLFRKVYWGYAPSQDANDPLSQWSWNLISFSGVTFSYLNFFVNRLILPFSSVTSVIGFMLLLAILIQLLSGFFLGWYYIPEPGLVIELREEMFNDTHFGSEIFYFHIRGVDIIFVLSYLHIFKKIYLKNYVTSESDGWIIGGYAFFWFHYIVALGISLSATHLSDLTLTIIANIVWSLTDNLYKTYYIVFTNKHLNVDQMTRFMVLHYFSPWYYLYLIQVHVMFCHESWDSDSGENVYEDKSGSYISWFFDAFLKEIQDAWFWVIFCSMYFWMHHMVPYAINYFFFERWNIAENDEIRFYGVAPHWYFRPLMGILVISPTHYEGLMWVGLYFLFLAFLPTVYNFYNGTIRFKVITAMQNSLTQSTSFSYFLMSIFCVSSMLPCGRYYYEPEGGYVGNPIVKFSLQYVFLYFAWILHHLELIDRLVFQFFLFFSKFSFKKMLRKFLKKYCRWEEETAKSFTQENFTEPSHLYCEETVKRSKVSTVSIIVR